jgi:hypothetical protein
MYFNKYLLYKKSKLRALPVTYLFEVTKDAFWASGVGSSFYFFNFFMWLGHNPHKLMLPW